MSILICLKKNSQDPNKIIIISQMNQTNSDFLVVLDLNGVLVDKQWNVTNRNHIKEKKLEVNVRPGARNFIENLSRKYTVCIWSSAMKHTIKKILNEIFNSSESITDSIKFILTQKSCTIVDGIERKQFLTEKEYEKYVKKDMPLFMKDIKNIPFVDKFSKILFIDNSVEKLLKNPRDSYYLVETWKKDSNHSVTLEDIEKCIDYHMIEIK